MSSEQLSVVSDLLAVLVYDIDDSALQLDELRVVLDLQ
jgi:hypothetical protein